MSCTVRVGHHLLLMCCIMLSILNLSHTFNSVIAQYGYCSTGSISNLCFSSSLMNAADAPTIAYTHRIQPLRYISSTARLLMSSTDVETFSTADIEEYAKLLGLRLQVQDTMGLVLNILVFADASDDKPVGYLNAFIRPIGILHLDTIQVKNHRQYLGYRRGSWTVDGPGISFILGSWAMKWAYDKGCRRAELLAVRDSELMNLVLVRLYESFGFEKMREVGESYGSIPDRLVWGAVGTLMRLDLDGFYAAWTPRFKGLYSRAVMKQQENASYSSIANEDNHGSGQ